MKIRNGFVSNSSSSSFVLLGYKADVTKQMEDDDDFLYNSGFDSLSGSDDGVTDGSTIVGKFIADIHDDDYGVNSQELDLQTILDEVTKLKETIPSDEPIKLYTGVRSC